MGDPEEPDPAENPPATPAELEDSLEAEGSAESGPDEV